jgi:NADPH-dependent 2,4-dienoyl-CoA reductase/sulfur reductase-like enzyme
LKKLALDYYVEVREGTVLQIDRSRKSLLLDDGDEIQYQYLLLAPGEQFDVSKLNPDLALLKRGVANVTKTNLPKIKREIQSVKESGGNILM